MKKSLLAGVALLLLFIVAAVLRRNFEFLFYASTLIILLGALIALDRRFDFSVQGLWGFNAWLVMHLLGGMASIGGVRLYDFMLLPVVGEPYHILKYDQFVHVYCYIVMAVLVYEALSQVIPATHRRTTAVVAVLAASGIGGLNEVIEFSAVVIVGSTGVGGYTNTALDLCANFLGAIIGGAYRAASPHGGTPA